LRILKELLRAQAEHRVSIVSPITIRLRILKVRAPPGQHADLISVSPITIRLRILKDGSGDVAHVITVVSPITIRLRILKVRLGEVRVTHHYRFTHHDPLEDTESAGNMANAGGGLCFTHHDPLEDTERNTQRTPLLPPHTFHPSRSA